MKSLMSQGCNVPSVVTLCKADYGILKSKEYPSYNGFSENNFFKWFLQYPGYEICCLS